MKKLITVLVMLAGFSFLMQLTTGQAIAGTMLTSVPIPGGSGGLTCACTNLTKKSIDIRLVILTSVGGGSEVYATIPPFSMRGVGIGSGTSDAICRVEKQNGRTLSTKQVACSFYSEDSTGRLIVPVDKKLK